MSVRNVNDDEVLEYLRCLRTGFLADTGNLSDEDAVWFRDHAELDRVWSAFDDDGKQCSTGRTFTSELTVPGGASVPMAAVTQVTVMPTHRRRGHLTGMMDAMVRDARERGEIVAGLIASEWPIYGRFGYGPATEWATLRLDTRLARFQQPQSRGCVELVDRPTFRALAPEPFEEHRRTTPGAVARDPRWWDVLSGVDLRPNDKPAGNEVRAVHRDDQGRVDGYVVYQPKERWEDGTAKSRLDLTELIATSTVAYRDLWRYLCDVDLTIEVRAWPRPVDEPLPLHLVDGRALRWRERSDHLWVLVLDVVGALEARRYRVGGTIVLDIDGQRYRLEGGPDGAACAPTTEAADLRLPVASLGATYLGGTRFHALAGAGRVEEVQDGALARADAMFGTDAAPFLSTNF
jgi:predicted acetyltransferase